MNVRPDNVVELVSPERAAEAWQAYADLVCERERDNRWLDLDLNKRIGRAWDRWWSIERNLDGRT